MLKVGTVRQVIKGVLQAGDNSPGIFNCLQECYDRPRLICCAHVQVITNTSLLKNENGNELHCLHYTVNQHLWALKGIGYDLSEAFITSILEHRLNKDFLIKWQRHSHESRKVPHYQSVLDFLKDF